MCASDQYGHWSRHCCLRRCKLMVRHKICSNINFVCECIRPFYLPSLCLNFVWLRLTESHDYCATRAPLADSNGAVPRTRWRLQVLFWDLPDFLPCFSQNCGGSTGPSIRLDAGLGEKGYLFNNHQKKSHLQQTLPDQEIESVISNQHAEQFLGNHNRQVGIRQNKRKHSICIRPAPNTGKWEQHVSI